jgi:ribosomal protein S12 methylthiotransferase accessory factor
MAILRLAPGTEWVSTAPDEAIFRAVRVQATVKGSALGAFVDGVLPLLDEGTDLARIAMASGDVPLPELERMLGELMTSGIVQSVEAPAAASRAAVMVQAISTEGRREDVALHRLSEARVAVFGLESTGAALARHLVTWSPGALVLFDPSAPRPDDPSGLVGETRQAALAAELGIGGAGVVVEAEATAWSAEAIQQAAERADVLIAAVDRDFAAAAHWVNQAAVAQSKPAAFLTMDGAVAEIGPIVYPGETACYMCYRMRAIACADDYAAAMAFEERRDRQRAVSARREPTFLPTLSVAAGILAGELAKTLTAVGRHALAGRVMLWDGMGGLLSEHDVVRQPACPVCGKKKLLNPSFPPLAELDERPPGPGLLALERRLVDRHCGIVRSLTVIRKPIGEPEWPAIVRAELANFRYHRDKGEAFQIASGKGMDSDAARISALGEAVERYCGGIWPEEAVRRATRSELDDDSIDPRDLVLYPEAAYATLPYDRFTDRARLGWVMGRDLGRDAPVALPAQPVLMAYSLRQDEARLCQATSNGLAAGPTLAEAALRATYEVIERDAIISAWLLGLRGSRVDPASIGLAETDALLAAHRRRRVDIELYRLHTTLSLHCMVAIAVAADEERLPAFVLGLGADHDAVAAARSALLEVAQVRPGLRYRMADPKVLAHRAELWRSPTSVATLEDHDLYYSGFEAAEAIGVLRGGEARSLAEVAPSAPPRGVIERLRTLAEELAAEGHRLCVADLTPPDMAPFGLHAARAVVAGYQPIYFGEAERRPALPRLARIAARFPGARYTPDALNPNPHPIA